MVSAKVKQKIKANIPYNKQALANIKLRDYFHSDRIYIFHHIPKCGGTSMQKLLRNWFVVKLDGPSMVGYEKWKKNPMKLQNFRNYQLMTGHYQFEGNLIDERYPGIFENPIIRVFSFVRDPLSRYISLYYYALNHGLDPSIKLVDYIFMEKNFYGKIFRINENNIEDRLEKYFFIGTTERYNESIQVLSELIGKKYYPINHSHKSNKDSQLAEITDDIKNQFREYNSLDYQIYEYVDKKLNAMIDKYIS